MKNQVIVLIICLLVGQVLQAQDVVTFGNEVLNGEVKSMKNNVLAIETAYSDSDFTVDWEQISNIQTGTFFIATITSGERISGTIATDPNNGSMVIMTDTDGATRSIPFNEIIYLESFNRGFWDKLSVLIDGGYSLTKANKVEQINFRTNASYNAEKYQVGGSINLINSTTQDTIKSNRQQYSLGAKYFVFKDLFVFGLSDWLASDEQDLDLRTNVVAGFGTSFVRTRDVSLSASLGMSFNNEQFLSEGTPNSSSGEAYASVEADLFGYDDFSMFSRLQAYPSLTEKERIRLNFDINTKYDLPLDFYISGSYQLNYDSKPQTEGAEKSDYVLTLGVGWEF